MRDTVTRQLPLTPALPAHAHLAELEQMSRVLDSNPEIAEAVHADLVRRVRAGTGRKGLSDIENEPSGGYLPSRTPRE